jgi:hypothetical protein
VDPCGPKTKLNGAASVMDYSPDMIDLPASDSDSAPEGESNAEASDVVIH